MNPSGQVGLASIIVPCWNQLAFTRQCVAALKRHTRGPWELIVVDNGSTDGTCTYLAGVQDTLSSPVTMIANSTNRGFPAAVNQGLRQARGEYLVMLNNDVVVTDGWLDQLVALATLQDGTEAAAGRGIGLVGPMSNYAAPPQWVENAPYRDLDEMQEFARRWRDEHRGLWFTATKLSGFCLLMKRVVYERIGGLDERFGLGLFDDDDLALRARQAGFELAVARDLFVHHFGSRTFVGNGVDAEALLEENARRFADKWGDDAPSGRRVAISPFGVSGAIGEPHDGNGSIGGPRFAGKGSIGVPRFDGQGSIGGQGIHWCASLRSTHPTGSAGEAGDGRGSIGVPRFAGQGSIGVPRFAGQGSIGVPRFAGQAPLVCLASLDTPYRPQPNAPSCVDASPGHEILDRRNPSLRPDCGA